jgi:hypothetical protein
MRALAVQRGDFPDSNESNTIEKFWPAFKICFHGFKMSKEHSDLWLPFLIGFAELFAFPIFLKLDAYSILGGWLVLKTAGGWLGWRASKTSFNRFLVVNITNLAVSYFWLVRYIDRKLC